MAPNAGSNAPWSRGCLDVRADVQHLPGSLKNASSKRKYLPPVG
jgi:hypothetical protein